MSPSDKPTGTQSTWMQRLVRLRFSFCLDGRMRRLDIHDGLCIEMQESTAIVYSEDGLQTSRRVVASFDDPESLEMWVALTDTGKFALPNVAVSEPEDRAKK